MQFLHKHPVPSLEAASSLSLWSWNWSRDFFLPVLACFRGPFRLFCFCRLYPVVFQSPSTASTMVSTLDQTKGLGEAEELPKDSSFVWRVPGTT